MRNYLWDFFYKKYLFNTVQGLFNESRKFCFVKGCLLFNHFKCLKGNLICVRIFLFTGRVHRDNQSVLTDSRIDKIKRRNSA